VLGRQRASSSYPPRGSWSIWEEVKFCSWGMNPKLQRNGQMNWRIAIGLIALAAVMRTEQIVSIYVKLLPHEKPKLNSIHLSGTRCSTSHMRAVGPGEWFTGAKKRHLSAKPNRVTLATV
jgi:hypothetical protein